MPGALFPTSTPRRFTVRTPSILKSPARITYIHLISDVTLEGHKIIEECLSPPLNESLVSGQLSLSVYKTLQHFKETDASRDSSTQPVQVSPHLTLWCDLCSHIAAILTDCGRISRLQNTSDNLRLHYQVTSITLQQNAWTFRFLIHLCLCQGKCKYASH